MSNLINALWIFVLFVSSSALAQNSDTITRKLSNRETKELMKSLKNSGIQNNALISAVEDACKCIDSIDVAEKGKKQIADEINKCIDAETVTYQATKQIMNSFFSDNNKIVVNTDKKSEQYIKAYREIEEELMDSCTVLKSIVASNNKLSKYSSTENQEALAQYKLGAKLSEKGKYEEAIEYYKEAVKLDPLFVFAWDNLGVCYRKTNQNDKAIEAYEKSLQINPHGELPLQNIGVAYESKKEYDKAIESYKKYLEIYPKAEEAYFGLGRIFFFYKNDNETALEYMCKAYNLYVEMNSPYRVDAQGVISKIYSKMKGGKSEKRFNEILKQNHITPSK